MTAVAPEMVPLGRHHAAVVSVLSEWCLEAAWSADAVGSILATPGAFGFIAQVSGTPTAFILCRAAGGECEVLALGTVPGERRNGMARSLVERTLEEAAVRDFRRIVLEVAEDNVAARGLYARCGFSMAGRRPGYYRRPSGAHADALILSRNWGDGRLVQDGTNSCG